MRVVSSVIATLVCLSLTLCLPAAAAAQIHTQGNAVRASRQQSPPSDPFFDELILPGGTAALAQAAAIASPSDRSRVFVDLIRRLYNVVPDQQEAARARRARVAAHLESSARAYAPAEVLPLPLPCAIWTRIVFEGRVDTANLAQAILSDRRAAMFFHLTAALDAPTRRWFAQDPARVRLLLEHAEMLATIGRSLRIEDDKVRVPGGPRAEKLWRSLVEASEDRPLEFIDRLARSRDGRLAWFYDVVAHLPPPMQAHILGLHLADPRQRLARAQAMADVFASVAPTWQLRDRPMWRPLNDPALLLSELEVGGQGRLAGPMWQGLWAEIYDSDELPGATEGESFDSEELTNTPPADAAWLARQVFLDDPALQRDRLEQTLFAQRVFARADPGEQASVAVASRGFARFRALALSLERMGITAPHVYARSMLVARDLDEAAAHDEAVLFQGALALVERARLVHTLTSTEATSLVERLVGLAEHDIRHDRRRVTHQALRGWLVDHLVHRADVAQPGIEPQLLCTLTGPPAPARPPARITWEGMQYVVDPAAAELARLRRVRELQAGVTLDQALEVSRAASGIDGTVRGRPHAKVSADTSASLQSAAAVLEQLIATWPIDHRRSAQLVAEAREAASLADRAMRSPRDRKLRAKLREVMDGVALHVMADVLVSLNYAGHLPASETLVASGVDERHDFGWGLRSRDHHRRIPWALAESVSGTGVPWHLQGSLLSLDVALGSFMVRRISDELPTPTLNGADRQVFVRNVPLLNPLDCDDDARDRLAGLIAAGRARLARLAQEPLEVHDVARAAGLSEWREQSLAWQARHEPARVTEALSLTELLWLAEPDRDEVGRLDAWGTALIGVTGQFATRLPRRRAWEDSTGHYGSGLLAAQVGELNLRTAQWLAERRLPASLTRGILSAAIIDLVDWAPSSFPEDWQALVDYVRTLPQTRFDDYVAALTVDGPLRPLSAGEELQ